MKTLGRAIDISLGRLDAQGTVTNVRRLEAKVSLKATVLSSTPNTLDGP